jgi:hypothetical protein
MKLLVGFIAATLPAYHALAATVDWKNVSSNKRVCTKVNDGGNVCKTSVSGKEIFLCPSMNFILDSTSSIHLFNDTHRRN